MAATLSPKELEALMQAAAAAGLAAQAEATIVALPRALVDLIPQGQSAAVRLRNIVAACHRDGWGSFEAWLLAAKALTSEPTFHAHLDGILAAGGKPAAVVAPRELARPRVGALFAGRFEIVERLGKGGFATVWRARDGARGGAEVALKVLHEQHVDSARKRTRFLRGAREMRALRHPHVVTVHDIAGEDVDRLWIAMDVAAGGSLDDAFKGGRRFGMDEAIALVASIGDALVFAHSQGRIHRDVKPGNVLLDGSGRPLLTDFDLVHVDDTDHRTLTRVMGSLHFTAPEVLDEDEASVTEAADVYSLAMTMVVLVCGGKPPKAARNNFREFLRTRLPAPTWLCELLVRSTSHDPDDRPSMGQLVRTLRSPPAIPDEQSSNAALRSTVAIPVGRHRRSFPTTPEAPLAEGWHRRSFRTTPETPLAKGGRRRAPAVVVLMPATTEGVRDSVTDTLPDLPQGLLDRPPAPLDTPDSSDWAVDSGRDEFGWWAEFEVRGLRQRLRWIEPGSFLMGSSEYEAGRYADEGPRHPVTLTRGFWLGDTPVTQALWAAVMGTNPSRFVGEPLRPVEQVSWDDCQAFIASLGLGGAFRLPTEAQWEYACRAGTSAARYGPPDEVAWFDANSHASTQPVATKRANPWGLHDMLGNVWEWCADGTRAYRDGHEVDPADPEGASRVLRGGSWDDGPRGIRAAYRYPSAPDFRSDFVGLRLSREASLGPSGAH